MGFFPPFFDIKILAKFAKNLEILFNFTIEKIPKKKLPIFSLENSDYCWKKTIGWTPIICFS